MRELNERLKSLSDKYKLNFSNFKIIHKKIFFFKKTCIYYGVNKYFFEVGKSPYSSKKYFPYLKNDKNSDLENWLCSIQFILLQKARLLKPVLDGKHLRETFKKKFKV